MTTDSAGRQRASTAGWKPTQADPAGTAVTNDGSVRQDAGVSSWHARWLKPWIIARIIVVGLLSGIPIVAIAAHVLGLISQRTSAVLFVTALAGAILIIAYSPHAIDAIFARGFVVGMAACLVYDGFRLFAVHVLGWMGDFIATMGSWITGDSGTDSTALGYVWRYIGDGGGLGIAFFVLALALGLDRPARTPRAVMLWAVGFAVFVWAGLIGTVALAPHGQDLMFGLNWQTIVVTLVGHVVFGIMLGFGFLQSRKAWKDRQGIEMSG